MGQLSSLGREVHLGGMVTEMDNPQTFRIFALSPPPFPIPPTKFNDEVL